MKKYLIIQLFFIITIISFSLPEIAIVIKDAIQLNSEGKYNESINLLNTKLDEGKNNGLFYATLGDAYFRIGDDNNAQKYLKLAIVFSPEEILYRDLFAASLYYSGNINEAEKEYLKCVELDNKQKRAYKMLGIIYYEKKDKDKAIKYSQQAVELDSSDKESLLNLGKIYFYNEDYKMAEIYFDKLYLISNDGYAFISMYIETKYILNKYNEGDKLKEDLIRIYKTTTDKRIKTLEYFRFDSFKVSNYQIVAREKFNKTGDLYYYYSFLVYNSNNEIIKSINLETSDILRELNKKYIIGTDIFDKKIKRHQTSNICFSELPEYSQIKELIQKEINGEITYSASSELSN